MDDASSDATYSQRRHTEITGQDAFQTFVTPRDLKGLYSVLQGWASTSVEFIVRDPLLASTMRHGLTPKAV